VTGNEIILTQSIQSSIKVAVENETFSSVLLDVASKFNSTSFVNVTITKVSFSNMTVTVLIPPSYNPVDNRLKGSAAVGSFFPQLTSNLFFIIFILIVIVVCCFSLVVYFARKKNVPGSVHHSDNNNNNNNIILSLNDLKKTDDQLAHVDLSTIINNIYNKNNNNNNGNNNKSKQVVNVVEPPVSNDNQIVEKKFSDNNNRFQNDGIAKNNNNFLSTEKLHVCRSFATTFGALTLNEELFLTVELHNRDGIKEEVVFNTNIKKNVTAFHDDNDDESSFFFE